MATSVKTIEKGHQPLYVVSLSVEEVFNSEQPDAMAVPVMSRRDGAVPMQFLSPASLLRGQEAVGLELIGPSLEVSVLGVNEDDQGAEIPSGVEISCLLNVDFHLSVLESMMEYDHEVGPLPSRCFLQEAPMTLPMSSSLLAAALEWISGSPETDRIQFYSAAEEEVLGGSVALSPAEKKPKAPPAPKRVTTSALAEQIGSLTQSVASIPQIARQLQDLQERQKSFEQALTNASPKMPPHRQPFPVAMQEKPELATFLKGIGPPPRVKTAPSTPVPVVRMQEDEPNLLPTEEGFLAQAQPPAVDISQAVYQQSQALTTLVAHLVGQDGLADLGGASSSLGLASKGASRRNKLLADLAAREGQFFLSVAQNAFRRLKPTEPLPQDLNGFQGKAIFSKYLERQGGFCGQRDLGLMISDCRPDDQWRCEGSPRDVGTGFGVSRAVCSRWRALGSGMGAVASGGSSSWPICIQAVPNKSKVESFCTSLPCSLDYGGPQLCEGVGHYHHEETGVEDTKEDFRQTRGWGGGRKEETEVPKEESSSKFVFGGKLNSKQSVKLSRAWRAQGVSDEQVIGHSLCGAFGLDEESTPTPMACEADLCSGIRSCQEASSPPKRWDDLQRYSYRTWCRELFGKVMNSKTSFAAFIRTTLLAKPLDDDARASSIFPLPIPKFGIFESRKRGSRARRACYEERAFHVMVMALNFLHADFRHLPVESLALRPNPCQAAILLRLKGSMKVFGSSAANFVVPESGRRSMNLIALLADLSDVVTWEGLSGGAYNRCFPGAGGGNAEKLAVPFDKSRAEELTPYRPLDPDRIVLHGRALWDPSPYLPDSLWLPFQEPNVLLWAADPQDHGLEVLCNESEVVVEKLAKIWDVNGLLYIRGPELACPKPFETMRVFNCYKNRDCDRQITDRRSRNYLEARILGDSRGLPPAFALTVLEIKPLSQKLSICCSDRKDFYHQFRVSNSRAAANVCAPAIKREKLAETSAYKQMLDRMRSFGRSTREQHGDMLSGGRKRRGLVVPEELHICFNSIGQGDHLGVEFATASHRRMLQEVGLLRDDTELRGDRVFTGHRLLEGLVIDDFYAISVEEDSPGGLLKSPCLQTTPASCATACMQKAAKAYEDHKLLGSPHKDVWDESKAKVTGAEIDSSVEARSRGLVTVGAPAQKRLAMAFVSLELAGLPATSDALLSCLVGGWTSAAMFRRPFMSVLSELYKVCDFSEVDQESPKLVPLRSAARQELVMLGALCPLIFCNLGAELDETLYATDASEQLGAFVETPLSESEARVLWRTGNRKGGYSHLLNRFEALLRKIDADYEPDVEEGKPDSVTPERPIAFRYHFIEVCGGAGKVSAYLHEKGWVVGPVIDLDKSEFFDLRLLELLRWLIYLIEEGLLDSLMVEPPCTTFSPAAFPPVRSYTEPRGFAPDDPKTFTGTLLALRALTLLSIAARALLPALLEQPLLSKMAWLSEWRALLSEEGVYERKTSSCRYGSIHKKEFRFLVANMDTEPLSLRCKGGHDHIKIEGKYTKASAVYVDGLAEAMAHCFDLALAKKLRTTACDGQFKPGLEMPLVNDLLVSSHWKVGKVWRWKSKSHINILETATIGKLFKDLARRKPSSRVSVAVDSHVALASIAKGRSPSIGLRPCLRRIAAILIAGDIYPALHYAPTRLNPADHPSRRNELLEPLRACRAMDLSENELFQMAKVSGLKRSFANWARLILFAAGGRLLWWSTGSCWRFQHWGLRNFPYKKALSFGGPDPIVATWILTRHLDFLARALAIVDFFCGFLSWIFGLWIFPLPSPLDFHLLTSPPEVASLCPQKPFGFPR